MMRRDRTWAECWEIARRLGDLGGPRERSLYLESLRLTDADSNRLTVVVAALALSMVGLVLSGMWIVWRALLWSLGAS